MPKFTKNVLHIDAVDIGSAGGMIGMSACPGSRFKFSRRGDPLDDLPKDLDAIQAWGANGIVSLIEQDEFQYLGVEDLPEMIAERGMWWKHLPIRDMKTPDRTFETAWRETECADLHQRFANGERVLFHCMAGLGRTGLVAAKLLVETGMPPKAAIHLLREKRPGTIQTWRQAFYVKRCKALR